MSVTNFLQQLSQDIISLKTTGAWFAVSRLGLSSLDWVFGGLSLLLIFLGILVWIIWRKTQSPVYRKYAQRWNTNLVWFGVLGLLWLGLRYQFVSVISTRAVVAGLFLIFLVQVVRMVIYGRGTMRHEQRAFEAEQQKLKYLQRK